MSNRTLSSFRRRVVSRGLAALLAVAPVAAFVGCETYDSPPRVFVVDLVDGNLPRTGEPFVIEFSEPVDPATLIL